MKTKKKKKTTMTRFYMNEKILCAIFLDFRKLNDIYYIYINIYRQMINRLCSMLTQEWYVLTTSTKFFKYEFEIVNILNVEVVRMIDLLYERNKKS